ncbi:MAG: HAD family hydrolase [Desulfobulbaceae bacterium]|uniref:phosphoglycolate phosphatase n=1 Tax=Candidatus Desulfatifera sulfidica TaxID=2841691 RepID=A0A8J6TBA5_9BACT|nr:HAD family hydrolase [Candidatus Desulfatifera sulfidica]
MPSRYQALIFDLDGTLLDTLKDLAEAANQTLTDFDLPTHPVDAYRTFVGDGLLTLIDRIIPAHRSLPDDLSRYMARFQEIYIDKWDETSRPYPGIVEMLEQLRTAGIRMSVLSNKPQAFTELCVHRFFGPDLFEYVHGERQGIPKKPDPTGAIEIAAKMELTPEQCLYVGDTATDMKTGRGAGMDTVGVLWGFRERQELDEHGAGILVANPAEITAYVTTSS